LLYMCYVVSSFKCGLSLQVLLYMKGACPETMKQSVHCRMCNNWK
jgi:hypothetical protein